jgi:hypothetical protein
MRLEPLSKGSYFNVTDSEALGYWRVDKIVVGGGAVRGDRKKPMKRVIVSRKRTTRATPTVNSPNIVAGGIIVSRAA